jgi:signal transduction histidine kinase
VRALAILSLLLIWGVGLSSLEEERASTLRTAAAETARSVQLLESHTLRTLDRLQTTAKVVDRWLRRTTATQRPATLDDLAAMLQEIRIDNSQDLDIRLFRQNGQMIPFGGRGDARISVGERPYFRTLVETGTLDWVISDPLLAADTGLALLPLARRVEENGYGAYAVGFGLIVDRFTSLFSSLHNNNRTTSLIYRADGGLLLRYPYNDGKFGRDALGQKKVAATANGRAMADGETITDNEGGQHLYSFRRLENYPLLIVSSISVEAALEQYSGRRALVLAISALASVVILGWTYAITRLLRRREAESVQLAEALSAVQAASEAKSNFLAKMSHELRTPLNAILGFSEIITEAMFGPVSDRYRGYAHDIRRSGQHLLSLINDILDVARIEAGRHELHSEPLRLTDLLHDTASMLTERAAARKLHLEEDIDSDLPALLGDRRAIMQMLLNLYGNAIKFSPEGSVITGCIRRLNTGEIAIEVIDNGPGISVADLARVTQPFGRGKSTITQTTEGTGLGLAITKGLIELHGGRFELDSRPGDGLTARLVFPINRQLRN